mmetsp:Transcript_8543/g.30818  ORF Transcript_8543/g.30818 Transcript_8543/m.30818 type:complete len:261 (-) Transcript_8543:149-931(-)
MLRDVHQRLSDPVDVLLPPLHLDVVRHRGHPAPERAPTGLPLAPRERRGRHGILVVHVKVLQVWKKVDHVRVVPQVLPDLLLDDLQLPGIRLTSCRIHEADSRAGLEPVPHRDQVLVQGQHPTLHLPQQLDLLGLRVLQEVVHHLIPELSLGLRPLLLLLQAPLRPEDRRYFVQLPVALQRVDVYVRLAYRAQAGVRRLLDQVGQQTLLAERVAALRRHRVLQKVPAEWALELVLKLKLQELALTAALRPRRRHLGGERG